MFLFLKWTTQDNFHKWQQWCRLHFLFELDKRWVVIRELWEVCWSRWVFLLLPLRIYKVWYNMRSFFYFSKNRSSENFSNLRCFHIVFEMRVRILLFVYKTIFVFKKLSDLLSQNNKKNMKNNKTHAKASHYEEINSRRLVIKK